MGCFSSWPTSPVVASPPQSDWRRRRFLERLTKISQMCFLISLLSPGWCWDAFCWSFHFWLYVCMFICVHDPHVECERPHVVMPYRSVSGPVMGHFARIQVLKRLLQRTNLNQLQKVSSWCLVQMAHLASSARCRSDFGNLAQPSFLNSVSCSIRIPPFAISWWQSILAIGTVLPLGT